MKNAYKYVMRQFRDKKIVASAASSILSHGNTGMPLHLFGLSKNVHRSTIPRSDLAQQLRQF